MSINTTSTSASTSVSSTNSSTQVSNATNSDVSKKSSTESSFKEEMDKVTSSDKKDDVNKADKSTKSDESTLSTKADEVVQQGEVRVDKIAQSQEAAQLQSKHQASDVEFGKFATLSMMDVNSQLSNDIQQMVNSTHINQVVQTAQAPKLSGAITLDFSPSNIAMTEADAEFFVNLTQNNNVSAEAVVAQAQNMLNNGAEVAQVKQNVQISQTLLNALIAAKENNQPLRIDFDQNISVILRVGKDGAIAANFIPGDKAVEQYLRNNIETLKNTFKENELPYSDLSYSNRGSKQQKENRRNKQ